MNLLIFTPNRTFVLASAAPDTTGVVFTAPSGVPEVIQNSDIFTVMKLILVRRCLSVHPFRPSAVCFSLLSSPSFSKRASPGESKENFQKLE